MPGTLAYISPERLHGQDGDRGRRRLGGRRDALGGARRRRIRSGRRIAAETLAADPARRASRSSRVRPDLPQRAARRPSRARSSLDPTQRPSAEQLADELRARPQKRRSKKARRSAKAAAPARCRRRDARLRERALPGGARRAARPAGSRSALPFYPAGWPLGLAGDRRRARLRSRRAPGIAFALATAVLPARRTSRSGSRSLYAALAAGWLALIVARRARRALFARRPAARAVRRLGLVPLAAQPARGRARRAAQAAPARARRGARRRAAARHASRSTARRRRRARHRRQHRARPPSPARSRACSPPIRRSSPRPPSSRRPRSLLPYCRGRGPWSRAGFGAAYLAAAVARRSGRAAATARSAAPG